MLLENHGFIKHEKCFQILEEAAQWLRAKVLIQSFEFVSISIAFYKHFNVIQRRVMQASLKHEIQSL